MTFLTILTLDSICPVKPRYFSSFVVVYFFLEVGINCLDANVNHITYLCFDQGDFLVQWSGGLMLVPLLVRLSSVLSYPSLDFCVVN